MDGFQYTFNGLGEYILMGTDIEETTVAEGSLRNPNDTKKITINVRHLQVENTDGEPQRGTIFGAYAIHVTDSLIVYIGMNKQHTELEIRVAGANFNYSHWFETASVMDSLSNDGTIAGVVVTKSSPNSVTLFYDQALTFEVAINQRQLSHKVSMEPGRYETKTFGLLGNFNGNANDELTPRGTNQSLSPDSSDEHIYTNFGETWRLRDNAENLFTLFYTTNENYETFNGNTDYRPAYFKDLLETEERLAVDDADRAAALQATKIACNGNNECLFDWLLTRNLEAASLSASAVNESTDISRDLDNTRPNITAPLYVVAFHNRPVAINVTAQDSDINDTVTVTVVGLDGFGPWSYDNVETLIWTPNYVPNSEKAPNITLNAQDSQGGVAAAVTVKIRYCNCLNGGSCSDDTKTQAGYNIEDDFLLLQCDCDIGWSGIDCSLQYDACVDNPCDYSVCTDLGPAEEAAQMRGFACGPCETGYKKVNASDTLSNCADDNECLTNGGQGDCIAPAICVNTVGSFTCTCPGGYLVSDSSLGCTNIDECAQQTSGCEQLCADEVPFFTCGCYQGYTLQANNRSCIESGTDANRCPDDNQCSQFCRLDESDSSLILCYCREGYQLSQDGKISENIDECDLEQDSCDEHSVCTDSEGSYDCTCNTGFKLADNLRTCLPCESGHWGENCTETCLCRDLSTPCNTVIGCTACPDGFEVSGNCDQEIDECTAGSPCGAHTAGCENLPGSFQCICADGYKYNNQTTCQDIDECESSPCWNGASCNNEVNRYSCSCVAGFQGTNCERDVNECESMPCLNNGTCHNLNNAFTCTCTSPLQGSFCKTTTVTVPTITGKPGEPTASSEVWRLVVAGAAGALFVLIIMVVFVVLRRVRRRTRNDIPSREESQADKLHFTDNTEGPYRNLPDMGVYDDITDRDLYMELDDNRPISEPEYNNTPSYTTLSEIEKPM